MCSINHDLKAIFIHIPKCGGLFIEKILEKKYNFVTHYFTHENNKEFMGDEVIDNDNNVSNKVKGFLRIKKNGVLKYYMSSEIHNKLSGMTAEKWKTYTKFTFIRNPYDRFISGWKYLLDNKCTKYSDIFDFVLNKDNIDNYCYFHTFVSQYENLLNMDNVIDINYFGRFENLNEDLCDILLKIGVKQLNHREIIFNNFKLNKSSHENYSTYYNVQLLNEINNLLDDDFKYFNQFNKVNNIKELKEESKKYYISNDDFNRNNIILLKKLDIDGKINKNETENNETKIIETKMSETKMSETKNNKKIDINFNIQNIQLDNGLVLDINSDKQNTSNAVDHNENFMKLLKKIELKYKK